MAVLKQAIGDMGADKACATCNKNSHVIIGIYKNVR
jgi:hypothetical protein